MTVTCSQCGKVIDPETHYPLTGYGVDSEGQKACYACCGRGDLANMRKTGKAVLYLTHTPSQTEGSYDWEVTNWPGTLRFKDTGKVGRHNIAGKRYDVWFAVDGYEWHGVTYGDNTQICHCRRTKKQILPCTSGMQQDKEATQ